MQPKFIVRNPDAGETGAVWGIWLDRGGCICVGGPRRWLEDMLSALRVGEKKWGLSWRAGRAQGRVLLRARVKKGVSVDEAFTAFVIWLGDRADGLGRTLQQVRSFRRLIH